MNIVYSRTLNPLCPDSICIDEWIVSEDTRERSWRLLCRSNCPWKNNRENYIRVLNRFPQVAVNFTAITHILPAQEREILATTVHEIDACSSVKWPLDPASRYIYAELQNRSHGRRQAKPVIHARAKHACTVCVCVCNRFQTKWHEAIGISDFSPIEDISVINARETG